MVVPKLVSKTDDGNIMKFTIENVALSAINALRRTIISDIPVVGFKTSPHDENDCEILVNTTRLNNEVLKHRLACIPVHIKDSFITKSPSIPLENYELVVEKKNDSSDIIYITTEDFKILDKNTNQFLSKADQENIFPRCDITGDYIDFARLRPKFTNSGSGEELKLRCKFSVMTPSSFIGTYNVSSRCFFTNTIDAVSRNDAWEKKSTQLKQSDSDINLDFEKKNWMALEGNRYYKKNSYDFVLKTIGIYNNVELITSACLLMIDRFKTLIGDYESKVVVQTSASTLPSAFDVIIKNEDYTLGKVLEDFLFKKYVDGSKRLAYCGFIKEHPHDNFIKYTLSFGHEEVESDAVQQIIVESANDAIALFESIRSLF